MRGLLQEFKPWRAWLQSVFLPSRWRLWLWKCGCSARVWVFHFQIFVFFVQACRWHFIFYFCFFLHICIYAYLKLSYRVPPCPSVSIHFLLNCRAYLNNVEGWFTCIRGSLTFSHVSKSPPPSDYKHHCFYCYRLMASFVALPLQFFGLPLLIGENIVYRHKKKWSNSEGNFCGSPASPECNS